MSRTKDLTPEQKHARRVKRKLIVKTVACPVCTAGKGHLCRGKRGENKERYSPHRERITAFYHPSARIG